MSRACRSSSAAAACQGAPRLVVPSCARALRWAPGDGVAGASESGGWEVMASLGSSVLEGLSGEVKVELTSALGSRGHDNPPCHDNRPLRLLD